MKLRAIITAMVIALATPAFGDISDYDSMHSRLADVLGSRAQADAAYDKLMQEANTYGDRPVRPGAGVVEHHIGLAERASAASNKCATSAASEASTAKRSAPMSPASGRSLSILRAARPTLKPAAANPRATDALMPEPAPTIKAVRYGMSVMDGLLSNDG